MRRTVGRRRMRDFDVETWYNAMPADDTKVVSSGLLSNKYNLRLIARGSELMMRLRRQRQSKPYSKAQPKTRIGQ